MTKENRAEEPPETLQSFLRGRIGLDKLDNKWLALYISEKLIDILET
jgi:hypothetical protein